MDREAESLETRLDEEKGPWRKWIALILLAVIAGLAWETMDPGKIRSVVLVILAAFAARILLVNPSR